MMKKVCPTYAPDLAKFTRKLIEEKNHLVFIMEQILVFVLVYEFAKEIFKIKI